MLASEIYRKNILPYYLVITDGRGVTREYIDESCPSELEPYEIAYKMKLKQTDSFAYAWVGSYVASAVTVAVDYCLNGRKARSEYIKEQLMKDDETERENKLKKEREKFMAGLMAMKANFELNHPKKEVDHES